MRFPNHFQSLALAFFIAVCSQTCSQNPFSDAERDILDHQNRRTIERIAAHYLHSPAPEIRLRLCLALANSRDTLQVYHLEKLLIDPSPLVRSGAAFALGQLPCERARDLLVNHISIEDDRETLHQIAIALGQIVSTRNIDGILNPEKVKSDEWLCEALIQAMQRQVYSWETLRYLAGQLLTGTPAVRLLAATALSRLRDRNLLREWTDELQTALAGSDNETSLKIIACLASQNYFSKANLWQKLISDPDSRIRIEAARGMGELATNHYILRQALKDSNAIVIATALENLPDSLALTYNLTTELHNLKRHPSPAVRRALAKYMTARYGASILPAYDLWPPQNQFWPGIIEGLSDWGKPAALVILDSLAQHPYQSISTPAYTALIALAGQLYPRNAISAREFGARIQRGLQSDDPVQIALAAEAMRDTAISAYVALTPLYASLKKFRRADYTDAVLEILKTIAVLRPVDGAVYLEPLLTARDYRVRNLARQIARDVYRFEIRPMPDDYFGAGKRSNLSKLAKYGLRPTILLETERGKILIRLDGYYAPFTVDAFLTAVEKGFYNGLTFHRTVPNFVIQGGDPRGDGWGGPGYTLLTERSPLGFTAGAVGMARSDYDTEGSQFFITLTSQPHLNYQYTRFGEVVAGLEVAAQIERGDRILAVTVLE